MFHSDLKFSTGDLEQIEALSEDIPRIIPLLQLHQLQQVDFNSS
jgi:hypothetical protein